MVHNFECLFKIFNFERVLTKNKNNFEKPVKSTVNVILQNRFSLTSKTTIKRHDIFTEYLCFYDTGWVLV